MPKKCDQCGADIAPGAAFCTNCGSKAPEEVVVVRQPEEEPVKETVKEDVCMKCGSVLADGAAFCTSCGTPRGAAQTESPVSQPQPQPQYVQEPSRQQYTQPAADIEKNKLMAVLAYIIFLIPLLAAKDSPFAKYHTNQGLVLFLAAIASGVVLVIPILGWIFAPIASILITVLAVIGIINALNGKAKELPIIGKFKIIK